MDDDGALIRQYLDGDSEAFNELMRRHASAILGFLLMRVRDQQLAEDLLQEVFLRMIGAMRRYRHQDKLRAWLFRIARNLVIDHERRRAGAKLVPADAELYPGTPGGPTLGETLPGPDWMRPDRLTESRDEADAARRALATLAPAQQEVFLLRQSGMTFKEIARLQGCPVNTALGRMHDAVNALRRQLLQREGGST